MFGELVHFVHSSNFYCEVDYNLGLCVRAVVVQYILPIKLHLSKYLLYPYVYRNISLRSIASFLKIENIVVLKLKIKYSHGCKHLEEQLFSTGTIMVFRVKIAHGFCHCIKYENSPWYPGTHRVSYHRLR